MNQYSGAFLKFNSPFCRLTPCGHLVKSLSHQLWFFCYELWHLFHLVFLWAFSFARLSCAVVLCSVWLVFIIGRMFPCCNIFCGRSVGEFFLATCSSHVLFGLCFVCTMCSSVSCLNPAPYLPYLLFLITLLFCSYLFSLCSQYCARLLVKQSMLISTFESSIIPYHKTWQSFHYEIDLYK